MAPTAHQARSWFHLAVALALLGGPGAPSANAQVVPQPTSISRDLPSADFLFGRPRASIAIRGGLVLNREQSDIFDFLQDQLTIDKGDFRSPAFAADVGIAVTDRLDAVAGFEFANKAVLSEYRDFVDNNFLPIEQQSELNQKFVTGSLKFAVTPRGHRAGSFAWVPSRLTPYIGGGGGVIWWRFLQSGDFVDFQDLGVFTTSFESSGVSPTGHVFAGADVQVYKRAFFTVEGRYVWASGTLDRDFIGFAPIDLSGFRTSAGINVVF